MAIDGHGFFSEYFKLQFLDSSPGCLPVLATSSATICCIFPILFLMVLPVFQSAEVCLRQVQLAGARASSHWAWIMVHPIFHRISHGISPFPRCFPLPFGEKVEPGSSRITWWPFLNLWEMMLTTDGSDESSAKEMVMSQENIKRKKSALDFNAIEAEPFIKALKDRVRRKLELGGGMMVVGRAPRGQLMSNSCSSGSRVIIFAYFCTFDIQQCLRNWLYMWFFDEIVMSYPMFRCIPDIGKMRGR